MKLEITTPPSHITSSREELADKIKPWMIDLWGDNPKNLEPEQRDQFFRDEGMIYAFICTQLSEAQRIMPFEAGATIKKQDRQCCNKCGGLGMVPSDDLTGDVMNTPCPICNSRHNVESIHGGAGLLTDKPIPVPQLVQALSIAQPVMEAWASSHELHEWHCRCEDLIGTAYPDRVFNLPNAESIHGGKELES